MSANPRRVGLPGDPLGVLARIDACEHAELVPLPPEPDGVIFARCTSCLATTFPVNDPAFVRFLEELEHEALALYDTGGVP